MKKAIALSAVLAALAMSSSALAHHSTNLAYDSTKNQTWEGEFVRWRWINPHALMEFNVTLPNGQKELWVAETHSSAVLGRYGWNPKMFQAGEKVTVSGNPPRKAGARAMHMFTAKGVSGKLYSVNRQNEN